MKSEAKASELGRSHLVARPFPYTITGVSAIVASPTPMDEWAERVKIPHREGGGRTLSGADITRILGVDSKSWDPELFSTLAPALEAARNALATADVEPGEIDAFITATSVPYEPMLDADALWLATRLGLPDDVAPMGLSTGCAGLMRAAALLAATDFRCALVVTYNAISAAMGDGQGGIAERYLHNDVHPQASGLWASPALFSDGAGALVLRRDPEADGVVFYSRDQHSFGEGPGFTDPLVSHPGGSALHPLATGEGQMLAAYGMSPASIKRYYTEGMRLNHQVLEHSIPGYLKLTQRIYLHQANPRIVDEFIASAGLPADKTPVHGRRYGNLVTVAAPLMLHQDLRNGSIATGDRVTISLVGGGPERGACFVPVAVPHPERLHEPHRTTQTAPAAPPSRPTTLLTDFVRGGLTDEEQAAIRKAIPAEYFDTPHGVSPQERHALTYERLRSAGRAVAPAEQLLAAPAVLCGLLERAAIADPALFHVMQLHYNLVLAPIVRFGDAGTAPARRRLESMESFGAGAMTEAGRSNSHLAPATTARFDQSTRSFVLTTPDEAAIKFPTSVGHPHTPKTAVVYAQLIVGNKPRGVFIFVIQLRDENGAAPTGVHIVPAPDGNNLSIDNAALRFTDLRVPFEAWLSAGAEIAADGSFHDPSASSRLTLSMSAAPHVWRAVISAGAAVTRAASALLLRHSTGRVTMSGLAPGHPLLGYHNQQDALLTALARAYALTAIANHVKSAAAAPREPAAAAGVESAWTPWAAVDLALPLLKATTTRTAELTIDLCRVHCGAPGYAASSRLNTYRGLAHAYLSAGGDNQLILFDTARTMTEQARYQPPHFTDGPLDLSPDGCLAAARNLEHKLLEKLTGRVTDPDPFTAWNAQLPLAAQTATAFAERTVLELLRDGPQQLRPLFHWYALDWAERHAGLLLDEQIVAPALIDRIWAARDRLRTDLMCQAAGLAAAFELPELDRPAFWSES